MIRLCILASYLALLVSSVAGATTDAPIVENNPAGAQYIAYINKNGLYAEIVAETPADGVGAYFNININGDAILNGKDYIYHIHELPVPEDGNCTATKAHLDPYKRGEDPICEKSNPGSCQVGDLSGKHGDIPFLPGFSTNYTDIYVSLIPGTDGFMGDKSFVLHYPNKTRIACANFKLVQKDSLTPINSTIIGTNGGGNSSSTPSHISHPPTPLATSSLSPTGSSSRPTGTVLAQGKAMQMTPTQHGAILGPLIFGIAAAVW